MEKNQTIHCTVKSCKYNENSNNLCSLQQITVAPTPNCKTKNSDESMCDSYECNN